MVQERVVFLREVVDRQVTEFLNPQAAADLVISEPELQDLSLVCSELSMLLRHLEATNQVETEEELKFLTAMAFKEKSHVFRIDYLMREVEDPMEIWTEFYNTVESLDEECYSTYKKTMQDVLSDEQLAREILPLHFSSYEESLLFRNLFDWFDVTSKCVV